MKKVFLSWMLALVAASGWAQEQFTGIWQCEELKASIVINLMEKKIPLKDFEGEDTYGYVRGDLNGTWVILKVKEVKDKKAVVRMVSDIGYDAQDVEFRLTDENTLEMRLVGDQVMKTTSDGKYVKMPKVVVFKKS
jgi:predicted transport protein